MILYTGAMEADRGNDAYTRQMCSEEEKEGKTTSPTSETQNSKICKDVHKKEKMSKGLKIKQKFFSGFYKSDKRFKIFTMLSDMSNFHLKKRKI